MQSFFPWIPYIADKVVVTCCVDFFDDVLVTPFKMSSHWSLPTLFSFVKFSSSCLGSHWGQEDLWARITTPSKRFPRLMTRLLFWLIFSRNVEVVYGWQILNFTAFLLSEVQDDDEMKMFQRILWIMKSEWMKGRGFSLCSQKETNVEFGLCNFSSGVFVRRGTHL